MSDNGIDLTRYAWVKQPHGYDLHRVGGRLIGYVENRPIAGVWLAWFDTDFIAHRRTFPTRLAAGRWLVERWEGKGNG